MLLAMVAQVSAQDLESSLYSQGLVTSEQVATDKGRYVFYGSEIIFDRRAPHANFEKIFAKRPFPTTLYSEKRRLRCYEFVLRENAQLASMSTTQSSELHLDALRSMVSATGKTSVLDFMKMHYIPGEYDFLKLRNSLNHVLREVNPRTSKGVPIEKSYLSKVGDAADVADWALELGTMAQAAITQQALSGDGALSRIDFIEETLRSAEGKGEPIDPLWFEAINNTRANLSRDDYIGCFMMVLKDNRDELAWHAFDDVVTGLVKSFHANLEAYAKEWFMHVVHATNSATKGQIAASQASAAASLWTISLVATIKTIEGLLDQHEKAQCAVAAATLDHMLHKGLEDPISESTAAKAAVYQSQISYYSEMEASTHGFLAVFHDLIAKLYGGSTFAEAADYFHSMKTPLENAMVGLLAPAPSFGDSDALLCFLIDSSGSMGENDPHDIRKKGLQMVVETRLSGQEDVVIVDFDGRARWLTETTYGQWTASSLVLAIDQIDSDGGTDISSGLREVQRAMELVGYEGRHAAVLLLSDGIDQNASASSASWFAEKSIPIHAVSLVGRANEELLKQIALTTGGEYIKARTPEEILFLFNQFYNRLAGGSSLVVRETEVPPGHVEDLDFWIDAIPDVAISLEYFGSQPDLFVLSPLGDRLDFQMVAVDSNPQLRYTLNTSNDLSRPKIQAVPLTKEVGQWVPTILPGETHYASMKIQNPEPGQWTVRVDNSAETQNSVQCKLYVYGESDLSPELVADNLAADGTVNGVLELNLEGLPKDLIDHYDARVRVKYPNGQESDISDRFRNGQIRYMPTEGPGNYRFIADVEGETADGLSFNRYVRKDVLIGTYAPAYIAELSSVLGLFVNAPIGTLAGNAPTITCYIYRGDPSNPINLLAKGHIAQCSMNGCTARVTEFFQPGRPSTGDILMLDVNQWLGD